MSDDLSREQLEVRRDRDFRFGVQEIASSALSALARAEAAEQALTEMEDDRNAAVAACGNALREWGESEARAEAAEAVRDQHWTTIVGLMEAIDHKVATMDMLRARAEAAEAERDEAKKSEDSAWETVEALQERDKWPACACMTDAKDDVCGVHSPAISKIRADLAVAEGCIKRLVALWAPVKDLDLGWCWGYAATDTLEPMTEQEAECMRKEAPMKHCVLVPCPGCHLIASADEGHHLCRACEGYQPTVGPRSGRSTAADRAATEEDTP